jgi:hypothetical protein
MKEFCKLNLTFSQDERGVKCEGPVEFKGTGMDRVYVLANICKALEINFVEYLVIGLEVLKTLRPTDHVDG